MKFKDYHFGIIGNNIVCWNGNDGWTSIAEIILNRPCTQLVRYANAGEDAEEIVNGLIHDTLGTEQADCYMPNNENTEDFWHMENITKPKLPGIYEVRVLVGGNNWHITTMHLRWTKNGTWYPKKDVLYWRLNA